MTTSLIVTKLQPPPHRPNLIPRPRLIERMEEGLHPGRKLTLISAPAGFGKTTLLGEWIEGWPEDEPRPGVAWLSLDEGDNDPARFLNYTLSALQRVEPTIGRGAAEMLQPSQPPPVEALLTGLINDIAALRRSFVFVLDDYHTIQTLSIHQQLAFLLQHQPPQMHIVIATREDPPIPLSQLRARGEMTEVRQTDLAFTPQEATNFLRQVMEIDLSPADVLALHGRTEGWIAGLQLAALSMQGRADRHELVASFTGSTRYILDYLIEEVFQRQAAAVQDFLLKTSILERLTPPLCNAVAGRDDSHQVLLALEKANLFIVPLDPSRRWYRYHHLFADLLRHRLRINGSEALASDLHRRASQWYAEAGLPSDAVHHALRGADWDRAADLILAATSSLLSRGETTTMLSWLRQLPDAVVRSRPHLCYEVSWPLILTGDFAAAESYLNQVERSPDLPPDLQVGLLVARAFIARARGDYQRTIALSRRALAHLPPHTLDPRCIVAVNLGIAYWNVGRLSEAEEALIEAEATAHRVGNHHARLTARGFLALIQGARGRLHRAAEMCQETIGLGEHLPATALARTALAALHYEWDEMDAAAEQAERSIELSRRSGNPEVQTVGYRVLARIRQAQGKREAAVAALDEADRLAAEEDPGSIMRVRNAAARVCVALFEGDLATAERWIAQVTDDQAPFLLYPHLGLLRTHLDLARGRRSAAARALVDWHRRVEAAGWCYGVVEVCSLQALTAPDEATALPFLVEALELAAPEGYVRTFIDKGAAMAQLLRAAVARGVAADYAHRLLRAFAPAPPAGVDSTLIELLSPRELEVLQLLPTGRTNQEIANVLFLSVNTVKTHLKNVYAKLGVGDRRQAVRRARDLGLIPK